MRFVADLSELQENIRLLDSYLQGKTEPAYHYAVELVRNGRCFLAIETETGWRFYPSRFIGYAGNSMENHMSNTQKDGRKTTIVISSLLKRRPHTDPAIEVRYEAFCKSLGVEEVTQYKRTYWLRPRKPGAADR